MLNVNGKILVIYYKVMFKSVELYLKLLSLKIKSILIIQSQNICLN